MTRGLTAGFARADITPEPGIHMGGYWGRTSGATGVHDPLWARAMVLGSGADRIGLVALDLVGLSAATVAQMRQAAAAAAGLSADRLLVCCTHTHAGPLSLPFRGMGEMDGEYMDRLVGFVARAVAHADGDRSEAGLAYARPEARLGINRRQDADGKVIIGRDPDGPTAPYAHVLHLRRQGRQDIVLFSHACHPVVLGNANYAISADFAGAAVRAVEERAGVCALFVNGACGDVNPKRAGGTFDDVDELGGELAAATVNGLGSAVALQPGSVGASAQTVELPLIDPPSLAKTAAAKVVLKIRAEVARLRSGGGDYWAQLVPRARLQWVDEMLDLARAGAGGLSQPFEIQGLRLGPMVLLGMAGEMFVRYQLDLEAASPMQPTALVGYANGCVGYVPTADEYGRGGYEVGSRYRLDLGGGVDAYQVYPSVQMLAPECEEVVRAGARQVLETLAGH